MNKLKHNVEVRGKGGNATLTSGDAQFDAAMNNNFRDLIQKHKARMGKENSADAGGSTGSLKENIADGSPVNSSVSSAMSNDTSATEPIMDSSHAAQPIARKQPPPNQPTAPTKQPSSTPKPPRQTKKKSPPPSAGPSRIVDAGPWKCTTCTFVNERNTTAKARCEMCDAVRKGNLVRRQEVEVVNIDC
jgi:hypothetical protein